MNALRCCLMAILLLCSGLSQASTELAGVRFEAQATLGDQILQLNGAGLRTRFFFKVYAMGLYLPTAGLDAEQAIAAGGAKRIHIVTLRELTTKQFAEALVEGIRKNHDAAQFALLEARVAALSAAIQSQPTVPEGMLVQLDHQPATGTRLVIDGKPRGEPIEGADFYAALLRIWLGTSPADDYLKRALTGATH